MKQCVPVSRLVAWPVDIFAVAESVAAAASWCWLDGSGAAPEGAADEAFSRQSSYLAVADEVRWCERGGELAFLRDLSAELVRPDSKNGQLSSSADTDGLFTGGWVTALSYEFGVALLGVTPAPDTAAPGFALRISTVLQLDHVRRVARLTSPDEATLDAWWHQHGASFTAPVRVSEPVTSSKTVTPGSTIPGPKPAAESFTWRTDGAEYAEQVRECQSAIRDGEAYVLCLTDRATTRTTVPPLELYSRIRGERPGMRGGVIVAEDRALVTASPERFLSVRAGEVRTHPIKGTRPRGTTTAQDQAYAAELAADPKERAENLMIVDLMRNDLSRVCLPGTVVTTGFLRVESHPHVHQLVSTVQGTLAANIGLPEIVQACFPGGSMTGAPKQRAVEILAELERAPRGLYSGCFGWISASSSGLAAELGMTIRCIELRTEPTHTAQPASSVAWVGAGGGITADSVPEREHKERLLKAQPLRAALAR